MWYRVVPTEFSSRKFVIQKCCSTKISRSMVHVGCDPSTKDLLIGKKICLYGIAPSRVPYTLAKLTICYCIVHFGY